MPGSALADAILLAHVYAYAHAYVSCLMPDARLSNVVMCVRGVCVKFFFGLVSILWHFVRAAWKERVRMRAEERSEVYTPAIAALLWTIST